jgi:hypothetical protein
MKFPGIILYISLLFILDEIKKYRKTVIPTIINCCLQIFYVYFPLKLMAINSLHPNGAIALNNFQFLCILCVLLPWFPSQIRNSRNKINKDGRNKARDGGFKQVSAWILKPTKSHELSSSAQVIQPKVKGHRPIISKKARNRLVCLAFRRKSL